ncbi:hypothetical protein E2C01_014803 [Portunus trituberculatus]|uniref:Uncharacterized protein n=1 Tax=Portunus trituberculatus TaxID=210409 RepID=A0A5B7DLA0_PORTR|nr:hypothetical protein [Portunus trituberculatus]
MQEELLVCAEQQHSTPSLRHSPLACVSRLAAAGVLVDAIHTGGTIEALVGHTLINVDLAQVALKALGAGAAVHLGRVGTVATVDAFLVVADSATDGRVLLLLRFLRREEGQQDPLEPGRSQAPSEHVCPSAIARQGGGDRSRGAQERRVKQIARGIQRHQKGVPVSIQRGIGDKGGSGAGAIHLLHHHGTSNKGHLQTGTTPMGMQHHTAHLPTHHTPVNINTKTYLTPVHKQNVGELEGRPGEPWSVGGRGIVATQSQVSQTLIAILQIGTLGAIWTLVYGTVLTILTGLALVADGTCTSVGIEVIEQVPPLMQGSKEQVSSLTVPSKTL